VAKIKKTIISDLLAVGKCSEARREKAGLAKAAARVVPFSILLYLTHTYICERFSQLGANRKGMKRPLMVVSHVSGVDTTPAAMWAASW